VASLSSRHMCLLPARLFPSSDFRRRDHHHHRRRRERRFYSVAFVLLWFFVVWNACLNLACARYRRNLATARRRSFITSQPFLHPGGHRPLTVRPSAAWLCAQDKWEKFFFRENENGEWCVAASSLSSIRLTYCSNSISFGSKLASLQPT
jgi:hypothetical protein